MRGREAAELERRTELDAIRAALARGFGAARALDADFDRRTDIHGHEADAPSRSAQGSVRLACMTPARDDVRVQRIRATIDSIPAGRVATYAQVADLAGLAGRARLVGRTLRELEDGTRLPWHRVIGSDGRLHTSGDAAREQTARLRAEGVQVSPQGRISLALFRCAER